MGVLGATAETFSNVATGVGSVFTALAVTVGGVWAYLRFRRTPESRPKFTMEVGGEWRFVGGSHYAIARVVATNDGGRPWTIAPDSEFDGPSRVGIFVFGEADELDVEPRGALVDWAQCRTPEGSVPLLYEGIELRPTDVWKREVLFKLPTDAVAVLVTSVILVRVSGTNDLPVPVEAFKVITMNVENEVPA